MTRPLTGSKRFTKLGKRETILWMQAKRMQKFCVEQLGMTPSKARRWTAETVKAMENPIPLLNMTAAKTVRSMMTMPSASNCSAAKTDSCR